MADALSKGAGVTRRTSTVLPLPEDQSPAILACISHSPEFIKALFSAVFRILRFFFPAEGDSHKRAFYDEMEDPCITTAWNTDSLKTPRPWQSGSSVWLDQWHCPSPPHDTKKVCFHTLLRPLPPPDLSGSCQSQSSAPHTSQSHAFLSLQRKSFPLLSNSWKVRDQEFAEGWPSLPEGDLQEEKMRVLYRERDSLRVTAMSASWSWLATFLPLQLNQWVYFIV